MRRVAIVGFGFMGKTHYGAWKRCRGAKVVAVCDRNLAQLTAKVTGNIKGVADNTALPASTKVYDSFEAMLSAGDLDIVDITLPTPLHAKMTVAALEAGCHVLCEKPMALTLKDCDAMLTSARKNGRKLLVAQCVRFAPEYVKLREFVRSGQFGRVIAADFTRFMSAPKWSPKDGSWLLDESKSGGLYVDAHVHDSDYILSVFGMPLAVSSHGHRSVHGYVDHTTTVYDYGEGGPVVTGDSSFAAAPSLLWDAAARVFFERATVYLGPAYKAGLTVYPERGQPILPKMPKRTCYEEEIRYFLRYVNGDVKDPLLTAADARESIRLVLAERRSAQSGKRVRL